MKSRQFFSFISVFASLISLNCFAISFEVIGPCSSTPQYEGNFLVSDLSLSVGKTSVLIFDQNKIPYIGSEEGFSSILNTPIGMESIEVISETKMRAYGWCYSVNGVGPDVLADKYYFTNDSDKLVWFFAYSTYDNGNWIDYCVPSYKIKAPQFCAK